MKKFDIPELEIVKFEGIDILTSSACGTDCPSNCSPVKPSGDGQIETPGQDLRGVQ